MPPQNGDSQSITLSPLWMTVTSCSFWLPNKLSRPPLHNTAG